MKRPRKADLARSALDQAQDLMLKMMGGRPLSPKEKLAYTRATEIYVKNWRPAKRDNSPWLTERETAYLIRHGAG